MIRSFRAVLAMLAAAAGCLGAAPASAQIYTMPEIGLQNSGSCPQFAVKERTGNTMVPLGCIDAASKEWNLQPRKLMTGAFGAANRGPDASIGPVLEADGTVTMFGPNTPYSGTWITNDQSLKCEPVVGPFHPAGTDLTRCGMARYITSTGDENHGEYGNIFNMRNNTGFPTSCQRSKFYPEFGSCLNDGGKMYRVKEKNGSTTYYGTTAASGAGPTGTGDTIVDGGVTWRYEPNFAPGNGGKTNLGVFTYQEANSGAMWSAAMAHQIATGGPKKNAYTMELDLVNFWGDYASGPAGPVASALQIFTGGPNRSTSAISIGQYSPPTVDPTSLINGMTFGGATLIRDNTVLDGTSSTNGYMNQGYHAGSAFTDGSNSAISFNSYGGASVGFRHVGSSAVGLQLQGAYSGFQVQGQGWTVNPTGVVTSAGAIVNGTATVGTGLTVNQGALKPAQYTVAGLFPCVTASRGSVVVVTDLAAGPTYRQPITAGGGIETALALCTGSVWVAH